MGHCMVKKHKDNPLLNEVFPVRGCPASHEETVKACHVAGIMVEPAIFNNIEMGPGYFMTKYKDKPEFVESFYSAE